MTFKDSKSHFAKSSSLVEFELGCYFNESEYTNFPIEVPLQPIAIKPSYDISDQSLLYRVELYDVVSVRISTFGQKTVDPVKGDQSQA